MSEKISYLSTRDRELADKSARRNEGVIWVDYDDINADGAPRYYVTLVYFDPVGTCACLADYRSKKGLS